MLSEHEWELLFSPDINEKQVNPCIDQTKNVISSDAELSEESIKIRNLCRICGSNGLINIHSEIGRCQLQLKKRNKHQWDVTIAQIISEISGEPVSCFLCLMLTQFVYVCTLYSGNC